MGGTDGFRGEFTEKLGPGQVNQETFAALAYAGITAEADPYSSIICVTGRDTRPSSQVLEEAVVAGALHAGARVHRMGVAPTPAVLRATTGLRASHGVMVSASHNHHGDNGLKITYRGDKPTDDKVRGVSDSYWRLIDNGLAIPLEANLPRERPGILEVYKSEVVDSIKEKFDRERPLAGKIFVVDAANGAAMNVAPDILRHLGAEVEEFACDGSSYINGGCGATDLKGVKNFLWQRPELVKDPRFMGAITHDGDADRMIALGAHFSEDDEMKFEEIDGNRMMWLLAEGQPGIVGTVYTNDALVEHLVKQDVGFEFCPNGDTNVTAKLREMGWTRGGEFSGHLVDLNWLSSGDGVRMGAWLATYASTKGTTFAELAKNMPLWPEEMAKVKFKPGASNPLEHPEVQDTIAAYEQQLKGIGRLIVRTSGTEPVVRVWGVGKEEPKVTASVNAIADLIKTKTRS